jgi:hypothetical protein
MENLDPPAGSAVRISGTIDTGLIIDIPRRRGFPFARLIFAVFFLAFVAFWTWGASRAHGLFACLSIPLWGVGLWAAAGVINSACEEQRMEVAAGAIRLRRMRPLFARDITVPGSEIEKIGIERAPKRPGDQGRFVPMIRHGTKRTAFGQELSPAEREWLVQVVRAAVAKGSGRSL